MSENSGFFMSHNGDRRYTPDWLADWVQALVTTGIYSDTLAVTAASGMNVSVAAGRAWVKGYLYENTAAKPMAIATAHATMNRKDTIVVRLDLTNRKVSVELLTGTPASSPIAPAIVRDANTYDLKLAEVYVAAGTTAITQAMVTDTRLDTTVCGVTVCTVQRIPTETFLAQMTSEFETWFDSVKGILGTDEARKLLQMIVASEGTEVSFTAAEWAADGEGVYTMAIPQAKHKRRSSIYNAKIYHNVDGKLKDNTWAVFCTASTYQAETGDIILQSENAYDGKVVFTE